MPWVSLLDGRRKDLYNRCVRVLAFEGLPLQNFTHVFNLVCYPVSELIQLQGLYNNILSVPVIYQISIISMIKHTSSCSDTTTMSHWYQQHSPTMEKEMLQIISYKSSSVNSSATATTPLSITWAAWSCDLSSCSIINAYLKEPKMLGTIFNIVPQAFDEKLTEVGEIDEQVSVLL